MVGFFHGLKRSLLPLGAAIAVAGLGTYLTLRYVPSYSSPTGSVAQFRSMGDVKVFDPVRELPKPFPTIEEKDLAIVAADKVGDQIKPHELVLGVVVNKEARAYPINMMTGPQREIFNDKLGGKVIAATW